MKSPRAVREGFQEEGKASKIPQARCFCLDSKENDNPCCSTTPFVPTWQVRVGYQELAVCDGPLRCGGHAECLHPRQL